jgi:hypothetical protein
MPEKQSYAVNLVPNSCCTACDWLISHPVFRARLIKQPGEKE